MPQKPIVLDAPTPQRRASSAEALQAEILEKLTYSIGKDAIVARPYDWLNATILAIRDRVIDLWFESSRATWRTSEKRVYYLSLEFLIGRLMRDAMSNLGLMEQVRQALKNFNVDLGDLISLEPDAALGNGGLGRLAACFLDSFAELGLPSFGYGLRYQYGMFAQGIQQGRQVEAPDDWMRLGQPWEVPRPELRYRVGFGGRVEVEGGQRRWLPAELLEAQAYDFIVPAHHSRRVSTLRHGQALKRLTRFSRYSCRPERGLGSMPLASTCSDRSASDSLPPRMRSPRSPRQPA